MTNPKPDLVDAKCRSCGRIYGKISIQDWRRAVKPLHGVVCAQCGSRVDAREAKPT